MAYRKVPLEVKVNALKEAIELKDLDEIAGKYGISRDTIKNDYNKLMEQVDTIIRDKRAGPKVKGSRIINIFDREPKKIEATKEDLTCQQCGSKNISRNGTYTVDNWLLKIIALLLPFLTINTKIVMQKHICNDCMASVAGKQRIQNNYLRQAIKLQIAKLICILRFKEGLSVRGISYIIKTIFGANGSVGYITGLCSKVSKNSMEKLEEINKCSQNDAKMMIFDETFPKAKTSGTTNLGVVMDENGLIRGVQAVVKKNRI